MGGVAGGQDGDLVRAGVEQALALRQHIRLANKGRNEGRGRVGVDFLGRADLLDAALVHHHHAGGQFQRLLLIVRDKQAGQTQILVKIAQPAA